MNKPTPQQHKEMWVYIVILTVAILILWGYFFKNYWLKTAVKEEADPQQKSWSEMVAEIKQSVSQGSEVFKQVKEELKDLSLPIEASVGNSAATSSTSSAAQLEMINKLKIKLEENKK
ncbi:MAG: hypothetical protein Q8P32_04870 [Candidatus Komeilibacteria bacterium]|nr:hypothetical protein [Candidatus Komeilibacteria bacterium]